MSAHGQPPRTPGRMSFRHASGLHGVTRALSALHREMQDGDAELTPVRTSVMNLVAACNEVGHADRAAAALLRIGAGHPARAIVIVANPQVPKGHIEADISLHCATGSRRVCTELVRLDVEGEPAYHLTSIVSPLLVPDMPVQLWVVGAPPLQQAFSDEAVALTEHIIIDSAAYADAPATLDLLGRQLAHYGRDLVLADLAWERTLSWRESLAQSFDAREVRRLARHVSSVAIECAPAAIADAALLGGWMDDRLSLHERGVAVHLRTTGAVGTPDAGVVALEMRARTGGGGAQISLRTAGDMLCTSISIEGVRASTGLVRNPALAEAELLGRVMAAGDDDGLYRAALQRATPLAAAAA